MSRVFKSAAFAAANKFSKFDSINFIASLVGWLLFLFVALPLFYAAFVFIVVAASMPAHATAPATVTVIGIPASKRADCHQRRLFAESIAQARIAGHSLDDAQIDAFLRARTQGQSLNNSCHVVSSVYYVWGIDGNAAGIGQAVYDQCLKEGM